MRPSKRVDIIAMHNSVKNGRREWIVRGVPSEESSRMLGWERLYEPERGDLNECSM